jgi:hypothetical protein
VVKINEKVEELEI